MGHCLHMMTDEAGVGLACSSRVTVWTASIMEFVIGFWIVNGVWVRVIAEAVTRFL